jgi:hypothetical protein
MKRRAWNSSLPAPTQPLSRRSRRMKTTKPKRRAAERERSYGPPERRAWVKSLACAVSGRYGDIEQAHAKGGGAGRKADAEFILPLRRELHRELHRIGVRSFEAAYCVDLLSLAARTERLWQLHQSNTLTSERTA